MGGFGDWLGVDVNCARQIDKERFDDRSTTSHVGWLCDYSKLLFGVGLMVKGCESASSALGAPLC